MYAAVSTSVVSPDIRPIRDLNHGYCFEGSYPALLLGNVVIHATSLTDSPRGYSACVNEISKK